MSSPALGARSGVTAASNDAEDDGDDAPGAVESLHATPAAITSAAVSVDNRERVFIVLAPCHEGQVHNPRTKRCLARRRRLPTSPFMTPSLVGVLRALR